MRQPFPLTLNMDLWSRGYDAALNGKAKPSNASEACGWQDAADWLASPEGAEWKAQWPEGKVVSLSFP